MSRRWPETFDWVLLQMTGYVRQLPQNLPGRGLPGVHSLLLSRATHHPLGHAARPMQVQILVEIRFVELCDHRRGRRRNVPLVTAATPSRFLRSSNAGSVSVKARQPKTRNTNPSAAV